MALRVLIREAPAILQAQVTEPRRCILATRLAYDVLAAVNVRSEALPVIVRAMNAALIQALEENLTEEQAAERGAWEVRTDSENVLDREDGYPGHLLLYVPDLQFCLDLDSQQFSRPAKKIWVLPVTAFAATPKFLRGDLHINPLEEDGVQVYQRLAKAQKDYRTAPNWAAPTVAMKEITENLVARVKEELKH